MRFWADADVAAMAAPARGSSGKSSTIWGSHTSTDPKEWWRGKHSLTSILLIPCLGQPSWSSPMPAVCFLSRVGLQPGEGLHSPWTNFFSQAPPSLPGYLSPGVAPQFHIAPLGHWAHRVLSPVLPKQNQLPSPATSLVPTPAHTQHHVSK